MPILSPVLFFKLVIGITRYHPPFAQHGPFAAMYPQTTGR